MAGLLEGNQFLFIVLLALVVTGALRVGIKVREGDWRHEQYLCPKQQESLRQVRSEQLRDVDTLEERTPTTGIPGPSWDLPAKFGPHFPQGIRMDPSKFRLHIKVLTFDRADSLERCVQSLEAALYDDDTVDIDIFVDHVFNDQRSKWSPQAEAKVSASHSLLDRLDNLTWSHGPKKVIYRSRNGGIQPQWLEAWWPESVNDFAFIVEDDMELSPMYYRYFKHTVQHYYYNASNFNPRAYGISFQRQFFVAGEGGHPMTRRDTPLLYQLVGTWGQFLFPSPWKEFRLWYDMRRYNESREPALEGLKTTQWWHNKGNKLWTPWIIKWAHARQLYTIYTSFPGNLSLSTSHREVGSNFRIHRKADAALLTESDFEGAAAADWWALPPMAELRRYDLCYRQVRGEAAAAATLEELHAVVERVHQNMAVALVMVAPGAYDFVRNWLCHIEGLNLKNYVLVVSDPDHASDLAGRGHPVYLLRGEAQSEPQLGATPEPGLWEPRWTRDHLQLVLSVLALGYNVLVSNPDTVWHADPFERLASNEFELQGVLDPADMSKSFLFVRSLPITIATWEKLVKAHNKGRKATSQELVGLLLRSPINFHKIETSPFTTMEDANLTTRQVPVVIGQRASSRDEKIAHMAHAGLWVIDDYDIACKFVRCQKKVSIS